MTERSDRDARYALRTAMLFDRDARARARAADRLGMTRDPSCLPWLLDATDDPSPQVRFDAWRAAARCGRQGDAVAFEKALNRARTEPIWWVRRAAALAVASVGNDAQTATGLAGVLGDPFWRVRHAAVQVLAALTESDPSLRERVLAAVPSDAAAQAAAGFLRAGWRPDAAIEGVTLERNSVRTDDGLWNPDPAVMTARIGSLPDGELSLMALIEHLSDPHAPLRQVCVRRLARAADTDVLKAACHWLEHPRIPHGAATVRALLDRVGERAEPVAAWCLSQPQLHGARRWAVAWVDERRCESLRDAAERAREPDAPPDALAEAFAAGDLDALNTAAAQGDFATRPRAIEALSSLGALSEPLRAECLGDPDPWVRAAAMNLAAACALVTRDPDRELRRAAMRRILRERAELSSEQRSRLVRDLAASDDARLRASACQLASLDHDLAELLAASHDPSPDVRFGAARKLERAADLDARIERRLDAAEVLDSQALSGAYTWLLRGFDAPARQRLQRAYDDPRTPDAVRELLAAMSLGFDDAPPLPIAAPRVSVSVPVAREKPVAREAVERRAIGPIEARPLAISGVFDLRASAYRRAQERGVELFFWEPRYRELTRFLREDRAGARVIAGSYEGGAAAIERDVERALKRLRRPTIDVFLLFWTRSPERLSEEALDCLTRMKREGKLRAIGFSTHHRDLARDAITAQPWDVVMTRHSAAHPGAETSLFPTAHARGVGLLTFSALSYGRMLRVPPGSDPANYPPLPTAADCYRYSLSQPGVGACIAAPRTVAELEHNLATLERDSLDEGALAPLRAHGARVRAASQRFNTFVRQAQGPGLYPTQNTAQRAALELLEHAAGESDVA